MKKVYHRPVQNNDKQEDIVNIFVVVYSHFNDFNNDFPKEKNIKSKIHDR